MKNAIYIMIFLFVGVVIGNKELTLEAYRPESKDEERVTANNNDQESTTSVEEIFTTDIEMLDKRKLTDTSCCLTSECEDDKFSWGISCENAFNYYYCEVPTGMESSVHFKDRTKKMRKACPVTCGICICKCNGVVNLDQGNTGGDCTAGFCYVDKHLTDCQKYLPGGRDIHGSYSFSICNCHCTGQTNQGGNGGSCASRDGNGAWCYVDGTTPDCKNNYSITKSGTRAYSRKICTVNCVGAFGTCSNDVACKQTYVISIAAANGGVECAHTNSYEQDCSNRSSCPVNCVGAFGVCSNDVACKQTYAISIAAANGGVECVHTNSYEQDCPDTSSCLNTCICTNGVAVTGALCVTDGNLKCASCNAGYTKNAQGTACDVNTCFCTNGKAVTGALCVTDEAIICASCNAGYTKNAQGTACDATQAPTKNPTTSDPTNTPTSDPTNTPTSDPTKTPTNVQMAPKNTSEGNQSLYMKIGMGLGFGFAFIFGFAVCCYYQTYDQDAQDASNLQNYLVEFENHQQVVAPQVEDEISMIEIDGNETNVAISSGNAPMSGVTSENLDDSMISIPTQNTKDPSLLGISQFKSVPVDQGDTVRNFLGGMNTTTAITNQAILKESAPKLNDRQISLITRIKSYQEGIDDNLDDIADMLEDESDSAILKSYKQIENLPDIKSKEDIDNFLQWANEQVSFDSTTVQSFEDVFNVKH